MRYAFVKEHAERWKVRTLCRTLVVSRAGYYAWLNRPMSERDARDQVLRFHILKFHQRSRGTYGSRRLLKDLQLEAQEPCSRKRVVRIMRASEIHAKQRKAFRKTTDSKHDRPIAPNILDRRFDPKQIDGENRCWGSDITYIPTSEGWLYLAVVLDLFSRRVIGWSMSHRLESRLVLDAFEMAVLRRRPFGAVLAHSDRGVQYASEAMQRFYERNEMVCSMSRKGNCWDNAVVESFFGTLKRELVDGAAYPTHEAARSAIFEYVEIWYNRQRRHSTLGYVSPEQFELAHAA
jgi:putative transposase